MLYADWIPFIQRSNLQRISWLFCPGHSGITGNERADHLAVNATVDGHLTLDHGQVIRQVRDKFALEKRENDNNDTSHTLATLIAKGVQRGSGLKSERWGQQRRIANQLIMETVSQVTLRWTLERRGQQQWVRPECYDANLV